MPEPNNTVYCFYTKDHPEANKRVPNRGERAYKLTFPLADGSSLEVHCGEETFDKFREFLGSMVIDDELECGSK